MNLRPTPRSYPIPMACFRNFSPRQSAVKYVCAAAFIFLGISSALGAASAGRVLFEDSIRAISSPAPNAPAVAHRATLVRSNLMAGESAARIKVEFALRMRNFPELQARVARGELIPRYEMEERYFPLAADHRAVSAWLKAQGLGVEPDDATHLSVFATGTVDQFSRVLNVSFGRVALDGVEYTSATTAPSLPSDIATPVLGIHGLQPQFHPHRLTNLGVHRTLKPQLATYYPSQIITAYNASIPGGITGAGQSIAVVSDAFPTQNDVVTFWNSASIGQNWNNVTLVNVNGGPVVASPGDQEEITLDTEWSSAIAPGAQIRVYGIPDLSNPSFDAAFKKMINDALSGAFSLHQFSNSYGGGEEDNSRTYLVTESQYMATLAGEGVSLFAASGDNGANADGNSVVQVSYPASDPSVTGVGGTSLVNPNSLPPVEAAWTDSGGGISGFFPRPSWQTGQGVPGGSYRLVPDVSATADPNYGAYIYFDGTSAAVGGTSWASPVWAGFCALINQKLGGGGLGALNAKLYPLMGTAAIRDITSGSNGTYSAGIGYDMVTGIGVPNVAELAGVLTAGGSAPSIISQTGSQVTVLNQAAAFSIASDGATPLSYQWQRLPSGGSTWQNLSDGSNYEGTATANLIVAGAMYAMSGDQFQCVVSNSKGSETSTPSQSLQVNSTGVTTLAGSPGNAGFADGFFRNALFNSPGAVRTDSSGNVYVADNTNNVIRMITPGGVVSTVAGSAGVAGSTDGPALGGALFNNPSGVAIDSSGNIYVADGANNTVRKISGGVVSTLAGTAGTQGSVDATGSSARFENPQNIAINLSTGNLYVPDGSGDTIRMITPSGAVTTVAGVANVSGTSDGTGSAARFNNPTGIAIDASGNLYVADYGNDTIREVTPVGGVTTIAGSPGVFGSSDGSGSSARFNQPAGIAVDSAGNIYVADSGNDTVREISPLGAVTTIAGAAGVGDSVDGLGSNARLDSPDDVAVDSSGIIYVADNVNNTIRRIALDQEPPVFTTNPVPSQTIAIGSMVVLTAAATGATSYKWELNGVPLSDSPAGSTADAISGSSGPQLVIANPTAASAGSYTVVAVNGYGSVPAANPTVLSVVTSSNPGFLVNISSRAFVGTGSNILIGGFYIGGSTSRSVLIQALGPALGSEGVAGTLPNPVLSIYNSSGYEVYSNRGWGSSPVLLKAAAAAYASPVLQPDSADSEVLLTLPPGGYTAEVADANGDTGVALCAIYQLP